MSWLVRVFGLDRLLEAILREFNLAFAVSLFVDFFRRWLDERVDNKSLIDVGLAAAARAEVLSPDGGGTWKYEKVFDAMVAESKEWLREEIADVARAFAGTIDDAIQVVHAKVDRITKAHRALGGTGTPTALGAMSVKLDRYANAPAIVRAKE